MSNEAQPAMWRARVDESPRWDLLEEALDEAGHQWQRRASFLSSTRLLPDQVEALHEERLRGVLDMLVFSHGRVAERLLWPRLQEDDREHLAVALLALLGRGAADEVRFLVGQWRTSAPEQREWMTEALALGDESVLGPHLVELLGAREAPAVHASVLDALLVLGRPPGAAGLARALEHPEPAPRLAALRAARRWPGDAKTERVRHALSSGPPPLRAAALETGLVQGQRAAWRTCQDVAEAPDDLGRTARLLLALGGEEEEVLRLTRLLDVPLLRRDTLWALGFSGRAVAAGACLEWLEDPLLGELAAEAFCAMTGLKLEGAFLQEDSRREEDTLPPLEDDLRTPLLPGPDEALPRAGAVEVRRWWAQARKGFEQGGRMLGGKPLSDMSLVDALWNQPMRRRPVLALELAIRSGGRHFVETRTWVRTQRRQWADAREWRGGSRLRPFSTWMSR